METAIALTQTITRLRSRLRQESSPSTSEISMPQLTALARIISDGPIANVTLATREHVRPQSMSEFVRALEAHGFVERLPDPDDGRRVLFTATAAGHRIVDAVMEARHAWLTDAIDETLSPAERDILAVAVDLIDRVASAQARR
jgi:DNA-binding MarR family transcriptional regulator